MRLTYCTPVAAVMLGLAMGANADPVTTFSSAPVTDANAILDDIALTGRVQNLMTVNVGTKDWTNSSIRIALTTGTVYNATNGVATEANPNSSFWSFPGARN